MSSPLNITKRNAILDLLAKHPVVRITAKKHLVRSVFPFPHSSLAVLDIGYDTPKPISDLMVDAHSVSGTMSFGGRPYFVWIPLEAIFLATLPGDTSTGFFAPHEMPSSETEVQTPSHPVHSQPAPTEAVNCGARKRAETRRRMQQLGLRLTEGGRTDDPDAA